MFGGERSIDSVAYTRGSVADANCMASGQDSFNIDFSVMWPHLLLTELFWSYSLSTA